MEPEGVWFFEEGGLGKMVHAAAMPGRRVIGWPDEREGTVEGVPTSSEVISVQWSDGKVEEVSPKLVRLPPRRLSPTTAEAIAKVLATTHDECWACAGGLADEMAVEFPEYDWQTLVSTARSS